MTSFITCHIKLYLVVFSFCLVFPLSSQSESFFTFRSPSKNHRTLDTLSGSRPALH